MSSPWEFAVTQIMQRHGGSNRSVPKAAPRRPAKEHAPGSSDVAAEPAEQGGDERGPSIVPDRR